VAVVLFLAGLLLFVGGHLALRRAGTGVDARLPALVETWPFSRSRNPMELGVHVMLTGVALALRLYWLLLLLPLLLAMCHYGVMRREENYLEQKFGATYRRYRARVRRWL
jgi:protein-S-isoprenylcysteine O-methyltransferase Ste14